MARINKWILGAVMKKAALGIIAIAALIGTPALAADMALKAPPPPPCLWCGWYVGANVGFSWGTASDSVDFVPTGFTPSPIATDTTHPAGVLGGAQAGFNWQHGPAVFGIETDIQGSGERDGPVTVPGVTSTCGVPCSVSETDKLTWFGTTRGRVGYAWGNWMVYATGGAAYGGVGTSGTESFTGGIVPLLNLANTTTTRLGWTAGAGIEGQLVGKWTWKVEYLYMDLGTTNLAFAEPPPLSPGNVTQALRFTDNIVRVGVNLHF